MSNWFPTSWAWLPSVGSAAAISAASAALFVLWIFIDCSFSRVASMAGYDIRFRFVHDAHVRYEHRWDNYGPRLLLFAILAVIGTLAAFVIILRLAAGDRAERGLWNVIVSILVAVLWIGLITQYQRIWWMSFRSRVLRLLPAMKRAAEILQTWPTSGVFLPGLGNYESRKLLPARRPEKNDRSLHEDPISCEGGTARGHEPIMSLFRYWPDDFGRPLATRISR